MIIATGPLTSPGAGARRSASFTGEGALAFFDAIAPIVHRDSIDMDVAWMQSRYDKEGPGGDAAAYVNCPMSRDSTKPSSTRFSRRRRPSFASSRARPISTAACRSR